MTDTVRLVPCARCRSELPADAAAFVPIYRVGRTGRVIYFVMKYLRGGSVSGMLRERGTLAPAEIRLLLREVGGALHYAAQRGVVHRDIKPDNIMIDESGRFIVTDFRIATRRLSSTARGAPSTGERGDGARVEGAFPAARETGPAPG